MDWYHALPPITRAVLTVYLATGLAAWAGVLPLKYLSHDWRLEFKRVPELWRLLTNFTFLGRPSIIWLIQLIWLVLYGGSYEQAKFADNTADGIMMMFVGVATCMALDLLSFLSGWLVTPILVRHFHASALVFQFVYLWSKQYPEAQVSLFGFIRLNGKHLPFAFLTLDLLLGGDIWSDIMGILMGHMQVFVFLFAYWFLTEVYPMASGRHLVRTPTWLLRLCLQHGIGRVPIQAVNLVNPSDVGFRAFSGRGRRLGN
ncbi:hypothetical protein ABPG75_010492 [Micractinium tetrahymenae]